ncbi:MAG: phosphate/phosphite/phosphonate ABC transporter substrate-binding protein, partial [Nitrospirota bacterium]|nr:phosphate/phosphite/phosphonate ABC transporter substrate-binding protein [Nitrospirota bacterium]
SASNMRKYALFIVILLFIGAVAAAQAEAQNKIKIGVIAYRGHEEAISRWQPTAEYLISEIPRHSFVIVPLDLDTIQKAVERKEVDFVITNPENYVELESGYGATRIATLKTMYNGTPLSVFGAVIFTRANRTDITDLRDLKGKTFMAVEEKSFGGWQMSWREFQDYGIDPFSELAGIEFTGFPQDLVVSGVRDGKADAGTVRTGLLESMATEGKINLTDFRILNQQHQEDFPQLLSTRLYPEWAFAKVRNTSDELAEQVVVTLLKMPHNSKAARAAKIKGWTVPLDYQRVHELMMDLRIGPYKDYGKLTFEDALRNYWYVAVLLIFAIVLSISFIAYVKKTNIMLELRVKERTAELEE